MCLNLGISSKSDTPPEDQSFNETVLRGANEETVKEVQLIECISTEVGEKTETKKEKAAVNEHLQKETSRLRHTNLEDFANDQERVHANPKEEIEKAATKFVEQKGTEEFKFWIGQSRKQALKILNQQQSRVSIHLEKKKTSNNVKEKLLNVVRVLKSRVKLLANVCISFFPNHKDKGL